MPITILLFRLPCIAMFLAILYHKEAICQEENTPPQHKSSAQRLNPLRKLADDRDHLIHVLPPAALERPVRPLDAVT